MNTKYNFHMSKENRQKTLERMQLMRLNYDLQSILTGPISTTMKQTVLDDMGKFLKALNKK